MTFDSQSVTRSSPSPSSIAGTIAFGLSCRYSGVWTTPNRPPASVRWKSRPSSWAHHTTLRTLMELMRPQILSMSESLRGAVDQEKSQREPDHHRREQAALKTRGTAPALQPAADLAAARTQHGVE